jgi:hypothetical protein
MQLEYSVSLKLLIARLAQVVIARGGAVPKVFCLNVSENTRGTRTSTDWHDPYNTVCIEVIGASPHDIVLS